MKILLDQNISFRVVKKIIDYYPEARQVQGIGLENSTDRQIFSFAKKHQYTIVTFDADFYDLVNLYGHPPKIIWLRTGNTTSDHITQLMINKIEEIKCFINDSSLSQLACLELD